MADTNVSFFTNTTSAQVLESLIPAQRELDVIARITSDTLSGGAVNVAWGKTQEVFSGLRSWAFQKTREVDTLVGVIRWQHRLLDYNAHYNAYLLNQMSENAFEKIAASFSYEPKDCDVDELITRISTILDLAGIDYTPSELADLFQCKVDLVTKAVDQIKWPAVPVLQKKVRGKRGK